MVVIQWLSYGNFLKKVIPPMSGFIIHGKEDSWILLRRIIDSDTDIDDNDTHKVTKEYYILKVVSIIRFHANH